MSIRKVIIAVAAAAVMFFATGAAYADEFSGFDLVIGVEGGFQESGFDYYPAPPYGGWETSEYSPDGCFAFAGIADALGTLQFGDTYVGISAFACKGFKSSADYDLYNHNSSGSSNSFTAGSYDFSDTLVGGAIEAGFSRSAQRWIYVSTGADAGTTYSDAVFHFGIGLGAAYRSAESTLACLEGECLAYYGVLRFQAMVIGPFGVQASFRMLMPSLSFSPAWTGVLGSGGIFVKL